ncbi:hypothetical protein MTO96_022007 [Rhipicephalus appendiculatus]
MLDVATVTFLEVTRTRTGGPRPTGQLRMPAPGDDHKADDENRNCADEGNFMPADTDMAETAEEVVENADSATDADCEDVEKDESQEEEEQEGNEAAGEDKDVGIDGSGCNGDHVVDREPQIWPAGDDASDRREAGVTWLLVEDGWAARGPSSSLRHERGTPRRYTDEKRNKNDAEDAAAEVESATECGGCARRWCVPRRGEV